jgi:hypothetical protein
MNTLTVSSECSRIDKTVYGIQLQIGVDFQ